ncbi:MAG: hypothetical protein ACI85O_001184 [Saprospiraceae bacterium]|jgi:hypothetical protein
MKHLSLFLFLLLYSLNAQAQGKEGYIAPVKSLGLFISRSLPPDLSKNAKKVN